MSRKNCLALALILALALSACASREEAEQGGIRLWFPVDDSTAGYGHGPALSSQPYEGEAPPQPEALLSALLAGPTQEGLRSPFPRGVALRQCAMDDEQPGVLLVNLSEQYGALTDVSLTLADYCIVLTLSQAEGVEIVEIAAEGRRVSYRSHQQLAAREAALWDELADAAS